MLEIFHRAWLPPGVHSPPLSLDLHNLTLERDWRWQRTEGDDLTSLLVAMHFPRCNKIDFGTNCCFVDDYHVRNLSI